MSKKISITLVYTMVLTIVALFAGTLVLAEQPRIAQRVLSSDVILKFLDTEGKEHEARIQRDILDPENGWKVKVFVEGKDITDLIKPMDIESEKFSFCEQDENGDVTIDKKRYFCHVVKTASDGAFLIGNHSCPYFLNPPGIIINLCPWPPDPH